MPFDYLTATKQKALARKVGKKLYNRPSPRQLGEIRQRINSLVNDNPKAYLDFHPTYVTPKSDDLIVNDTAESIIETEAPLFS